ncbi:MAG: sigma 54-interacting transcriptional regulator [Alphaproteobacteria bacterium]|nr:sigma 54-interacting transcriptional regulator [Alphaproteobacteria bacterium]MCB9695684.1 sigma 54-interacting transcriptional regulator [Alphaproteobacteria bacterium]
MSTSPHSAAPRFVGRCPELLDALRVARRFARTDAPIVITGPTGTGKELVARHVHAHSRRRRGPFVVVDCPNLPANLVEDELFGHARGAFTGAGAARGGLIEEASGGTLFLDEVGELPLEMQAKLLRFLQEGTVKRIGATERVRVDVRVVVASWRDLGEMVRDGRFREDLYHRLAWGLVELPPLRDRGHDIVLLAKDFLSTSDKLAGCRTGLKRDAVPVLLAHDWPGNVRELQRVMFRAAMLGTGRRVSGADIVRVLERDRPLAPPSIAGGALEERLIRHLEAGEVGARDLAHTLGVSRSHLQRALSTVLADGTVEKLHRGSATRYRLAGTKDSAHCPRWDLALALVANEGRVTRGRLAEALGVSERTASRVLRAMVDDGLLESDGRSGRHAGYLAITSEDEAKDGESPEVQA